MKPIYFPFTYISENEAYAVYSFFKKFTVYLPSDFDLPESMQKLSEDNIIEISVPVKGDKDKIDAVLKEFKIFGNLHHGKNASFFRTMTNYVPFFEDTSVSQIRANIRKGIEKWTEKNNDHLYAARVFLLFAQELDKQHFEIIEKLLFCNKKAKDLFYELKQSDNEVYNNIPENEMFLPDDPGQFMTAQRLEAWKHILKHDKISSPLFITSSRSVIDELLEKTPQAIKILSTESIPEKSRNQFCRSLELLAEQKWNPEKNIIDQINIEHREKTCLLLTLYIVPDINPVKFFADYDESESTKVKNTLIGLVQKTA